MHKGTLEEILKITEELKMFDIRSHYKKMIEGSVAAFHDLPINARGIGEEDHFFVFVPETLKLLLPDFDGVTAKCEEFTPKEYVKSVVADHLINLMFNSGNSVYKPQEINNGKISKGFIQLPRNILWEDKEKRMEKINDFVNFANKYHKTMNLPQIKYGIEKIENYQNEWAEDYANSIFEGIKDWLPKTTTNIPLVKKEYQGNVTEYMSSKPKVYKELGFTQSGKTHCVLLDIGEPKFHLFFATDKMRVEAIPFIYGSQVEQDSPYAYLANHLGKLIAEEFKKGPYLDYDICGIRYGAYRGGIFSSDEHSFGQLPSEKQQETLDEMHKFSLKHLAALQTGEFNKKQKELTQRVIEYAEDTTLYIRDLCMYTLHNK